MRGRDSLADHALQRWADEGAAWLQVQFGKRGLAFDAKANIEDRTITLDVYAFDIGQQRNPCLSITEPAISFVSHLTVTKIILVAG